MPNKQLITLTLAVGIAVVLTAAIIMFSGFMSTRETPVLDVDLQTLTGKSGTAQQLDFIIYNDGNADATGLVIRISSEAFTDGETARINVPADQTAHVACIVNIDQVASNNYPVTITYSYEGSAEKTVRQPPKFQVTSSVEFTSTYWYNDKNYVAASDTSDYTKFIFTIKSNTNSQFHLAYRATADANLTIAPYYGETEMKAQGTWECTIAVASNGVSPGTYPITLTIYDGDQEIAIQQIPIEVR